MLLLMRGPGSSWGIDAIRPIESTRVHCAAWRRGRPAVSQGYRLPQMAGVRFRGHGAFLGLASAGGRDHQVEPEDDCRPGYRLRFITELKRELKFLDAARLRLVPP